MHERKNIRDTVITILDGAVTEVGANVMRSRLIPVPDEKLPAILVSTPSDSGEGFQGNHIPQFKQDTVIAIDVLTKTKVDYDDELDSIAEQIETLLLQNPEWVELFSGIPAINNTTVFRDEGETPRASLRMEIHVQWHNVFEPTIGDDLDEVFIETDPIDPYDTNIAATGPDGRIDFNSGPKTLAS